MIKRYLVLKVLISLVSCKIIVIVILPRAHSDGSYIAIQVKYIIFIAYYIHVTYYIVMRNICGFLYVFHILLLHTVV